MFNLKLVIMKNLICLFSLMFAMVLMNTSCTKPTDDNQNNGSTITASDLAGTWNFISLETFDQTGVVLIKKYGNTAYDYVNLKNDNINYGALNLRFTSNTLNIRDLSAVPADVNGYDYDFTVDAYNMIHCNGNKTDELIFKIKSLNSGKTELKLQLESSKTVQNTPTPSAVYTFTK
jgi:hypothetical protein